MRARLALCGLAALPAAVHAGDDPVTTSVTVVAKKPLVVKLPDKTVYDVSNMPRAENGNAQDVLQSTPDVSVTADGSIAVKGNSQVTVLVNGKPTAVTSGTGDERALALQTMSGADIASIEVITNPSAAYNANGGAILNIVMKRNRKPGAHARWRASTSSQGLWNVGADGDLTRDRLSVHGSAALHHDGTLKIRQSEVDWHNPVSGQSGQTRQASEVFVHRVVASAALGADYVLSETDGLSLSARRNTRRSRPVFDVLNNNRTEAAETVYHRISNGPNEQSDHSASVSYNHQDSGAALKAMLQHSGTTGLIDKSYRDAFIAPLRATDYSRGTTRSARRLNQATLDWSRAGAHGQSGLGLDIQDKVDDLSNYQAAVDPLTGAETPDPNTTNGYTVNTRLGAAYLTQQIRQGKWEVLLGGRAELMRLQVRPAQRQMLTQHWQAFNPSLHVQYAYSEKTDVTLSYRRSLQMPDALDLSPDTTYVDAQNLSRGNPLLRPQRLSSLEISADTAGPQVSSNLGAFYRASSDTVTDACSFADNVLMTTRQNGGRARSAGVTGSLDWKPGGALSAGVDGGVYRVMLSTPDLAGMVRQSGLAAYGNVRAGYQLGSDKLALDAHVQSAGITPLGRYGASSSVNLSWQRQLSKTLSLTVNANDLFDGSKRSYRTNASTFRQAGYDHFVARRLYVGVTQKLE